MGEGRGASASWTMRRYCATDEAVVEEGRDQERDGKRSRPSWVWSISRWVFEGPQSGEVIVMVDVGWEVNAGFWVGEVKSFESWFLRLRVR